MQKKYRCFWKKSVAALLLFLLAAAFSLHEVYAREPKENTQVATHMTVTDDHTIILERDTAQKEAQVPTGKKAAKELNSMNEKAPDTAQRPLDKLRIVWKPIIDAVRYEIIIEKGTGNAAKVVYSDPYIFNNGTEIPLKDNSWLDAHHYWRVRALDFDGNARSDFTAPTALLLGEKNPKAPYPTSEFAQMDDVPLYPTYSWVAVLNAAEYEISVWKRDKKEPLFLHMLYSNDLTCYDYHGFTMPGIYYFKVRALDAARQPISDWSENVSFEVRTPVSIAALGDSITHGGGAISNGPDRVLYDWESYAAFPIKNLGYSGDTVEAMEARFDRDVLPFRPRILVIMGGVNNYRIGGKAEDIITVLARIRDKCKKHGIIPVFVTATSLNPAKIAKVQYAPMPPDGWLDEQEILNRWILMQPYCVDISTVLSDAEGQLEDIYTTDGLHPDSAAKRFIGETISNYLCNKFPKVVAPILRTPHI